MDSKCIQLLALLNQISVRGDDVERMFKARMLVREMAAAKATTETKTDATDKKGET